MECNAVKVSQRDELVNGVAGRNSIKLKQLERFDVVGFKLSKEVAKKRDDGLTPKQRIVKSFKAVTINI